MKKIVWILNYPSKQINIPLFEALGGLKKWELVVMTPDVKRRSEYFDILKPKNYTLKRFSYKDATYLYFPIKISNFLRRIPPGEDPVSVGFKDIAALAEEKPDLVISNLCYYAYTWQAAAYCKKAGVPFMVQTEIKALPDDSIKKVYVKTFLTLAKSYVFAKSSKILPWSDQSKEFLIKELGIPTSKFETIPPAINTRLFTPKNSAKKKTKAERTDLLIVSRLTPYKRIDDVIRALELIKKGYAVPKAKSEIKLSILGSGPDEAKIKKLISKMDLEKDVKFIKKVPFEKIPELYASYDAIILPSKNEAIGMVIPEAMACALPPILSDTCGATMYVEDGKSGYIFKTGDVKDLAEKIILITNRKRRSTIGKHAAEQIRKKFTVEKIAYKLSKEVEKQIGH